MENMLLEDYKKSIEVLAKQESSLIFKNSNHLHALIVLSNLIKTSKKTVYIYDDDLSGDIAESNDIEKFNILVEKFVESRKTMKIIVDRLSTESNFQKKILKLEKRFPKYLKIRISNSEFKAKVESTFNKNINFAIGDNSKFRVEYGTKKERKAFCSFNNTEYTKKFLKLFNENFDSCKLIS